MPATFRRSLRRRGVAIVLTLREHCGKAARSMGMAAALASRPLSDAAAEVLLRLPLPPPPPASHRPPLLPLVLSSSYPPRLFLPVRPPFAIRDFKTCRRRADASTCRRQPSHGACALMAAAQSGQTVPDGSN